MEKELKRLMEIRNIQQKIYRSFSKIQRYHLIETNNGACLFTQHFVYKIKENGLELSFYPMENYLTEILNGQRLLGNGF